MSGAARLLDAALEATLLGYTSLGYRIRRRTWRREPLPSMSGRVVLITGGSSGIGRAAAEGFARLGASLILLSRDPRRGREAREAIAAASGSAAVAFEPCDLSDLAAVRAFAKRFCARGSRLDVLINNAALLSERRQLSRQGIELTLATNVLGPFLLSSLLRGPLEQSAPARLITVSSGGMYTQRLALDDLQCERERFNGARAYAHSKRIGVILSELWAERLAGSGVVAHAMHPGWVDTPGLAASLPRFRGLLRPLLRSPRQGADTLLWLGAAAAPGSSSGGFWHDRRRRPTHRFRWTQESEQEREQLWQECERLCGLVRR